MLVVTKERKGEATLWRNDSAYTHTNPMKPASHRDRHARTDPADTHCTTSTATNRASYTCPITTSACWFVPPQRGFSLSLSCNVVPIYIKWSLVLRTQTRHDPSGIHGLSIIFPRSTQKWVHRGSGVQLRSRHGRFDYSVPGGHRGARPVSTPRRALQILPGKEPSEGFVGRMLQWQQPVTRETDKVPCTTATSSVTLWPHIYMCVTE